MFKSLSSPKPILLLLFSIFFFGNSALCDETQQPVNRVLQSDDVDEGSCICGLNSAILEKIEAIVHQASNQQSCARVPSNSYEQGTPTSHTLTTTSQNGPTQQGNQINPFDFTDTKPSDSSNQEESEIGTSSSLNNAGLNHIISESGNSDTGNLIDKLTEQIHNLQAQLDSSRPSFNGQQDDNSDTQTLTIKPAPSSGSNVIPQLGGFLQGNGGPTSITSLTRPTSSSSSLPSSATTLTSEGGVDLLAVRPNPEVQGSIPSSGFLQGLPTNSVQIQNPQIEQQVVQETVVSTVPNVVSNIFTNIQDFAIQTEQHPNNAGLTSTNSDQLTSIDGSSAHLNKNDTASQITAQGEQLFLQWIEHQIQAYHMTASMASYIRKSALNLFRRIVKQYVQRIERLGGTVENNVRQATQLALNNTQNLISFLLKNYLNFAGGLMQIIGEQVSRVGKQLDSTGETISHINLNPFDIVSNVIDSLPNPSRYSEYFRAFGKYLIGETSAQNAGESNAVAGQQQSNEQQDQSQDKRKGLFSKTMGALSKWGSWIG